MSQLKLKGATSGDVTLKCADVAGTTTATFPATTGNVVTTGDSLTVSQGMIADQAINEAKMQISNAGSNGEFLKKDSNATGGLAWEAISTESDKIIEGDTSVECVDTGGGSNGTITFKTENTTAITINNNRQTLIGTTTTPTVNNNQAGFARAVVAGSTADATGQGIFNVSCGEAGTSRGANAEVGSLNFADPAGNEIATIHCLMDARSSGDTASKLRFSTTRQGNTAPSEVLLLNKSGQATFFAQLPDHNNFKFQIHDDSMGTDTKNAILVTGSNGGTRLGIKRPSGTSGNVSYLECRRGNNGISAISVNEAGNVIISGTADIASGSSYGTVVGSQSSDQRLKNSITDYTGGLSLVNSLRPVNYKYNNDNTVHAGFIAQEVQSIIPEAVYDTGAKPDVYGEEEEEDGTKRKVITGQDAEADNLLAMHYVEIIPALVNSIKELKAEVDTLKAKVAALEAG